MIVDCHCHSGKGDIMTAPWNTVARIEPYLRRAKAAGIVQTIVFAPFHSDYAQANAEVARIVALHPNRLIGFAFIHAARDAGRIFEMVRHAVARWNFREIKVHGHDAMPTREVCEVARAFRLPLLVDVVGQASVVEMLASEYGPYEQRRPPARLATYPDLSSRIFCSRARLFVSLPQRCTIAICAFKVGVLVKN